MLFYSLQAYRDSVFVPYLPRNIQTENLRQCARSSYRLQGILLHAVAGCQQWYAQGLVCLHRFLRLQCPLLRLSFRPTTRHFVQHRCTLLPNEFYLNQHDCHLHQLPNVYRTHLRHNLPEHPKYRGCRELKTNLQYVYY